MKIKRILLWQAINKYAESCGGDTSSRTSRRPDRMNAVVEVEKAVEEIAAALSIKDKQMLLTLAEWFDLKQSQGMWPEGSGTEVQEDLRRMANGY